jgi:peptidyl-tRNA hydrolase, PTH1 family
MRLFVGLGNPGPEHAGQRHNIGFMAVDAIARRHAAPAFRARFRGLASELNLGERVVLLKPETYMNESGRAVREAAQFYKIALPDVVVFHDELDLAPGVVRVKIGGGNAGHNGLRSITAEIGNDYRRVRLGIGHPGSKERVLGYVLGNFAKSEAAWVEALCEALAREAGELALGNDSRFQNSVSQAMAAHRPEAADSRSTDSTGP